MTRGILMTFLAVLGLHGCTQQTDAPALAHGATTLALKAPESTHAATTNPVSLGPRPLYLAERLPDGELREQLLACAGRPMRASTFSIGHRGAPLMFPEHTRESYVAAARMGAGMLECDVTFTSDGHLVCRHAECDLHQTTNITSTALNARCTVPWQAETAADTRCCASDLTLQEFKTLRGKMDGTNPTATSVEAYQQGTPRWRTDLYAAGGELLSHAESIELFNSLGVDFVPELKAGNPARLQRVFGGTDAAAAQARYAQRLIDDYTNAGIAAERVWPQSFNRADIDYWVRNTPSFGARAVYLLQPWAPDFPGNPAQIAALANAGIRWLAPPIPALLRMDENGALRPSTFAAQARTAGLRLITWTLERSDPQRQLIRDGVPIALRDEFTYQTLHALAQDVGVEHVFSDWPATVTYYANCMLGNG